MASKSRNKGNYHERWFVKWLEELGFTAKRQPLSGSLGGEYSGDIIWKLGQHELVVEVKYRDKSNFPNPFTVVRDVAFYKRKTGMPKTLVIFDGDVFEKDIAPLLQSPPLPGRRRRTKSELSEDWKPTTDQKTNLNQLLGVEINHDIETVKFRDHHRSKGSVFKRPDLAYKKWCTNAVQWGTATKSSGSSSGNSRPKGSRQTSDYFSSLVEGFER